MRAVNLIVGLVVALAAVAFAVANRALVILNLWPLPFTYEVPIFVIAFSGFGGGLVIGVIFTWSAGVIRRRRTRRAETTPAADGSSS